MRARKITYWIATGLVAFVFIAGGAIDAARPRFVAELMDHLGYPAYFALIIGVWKVLGGIAVLLPGLPRLKEWAYAGMVFDLTGASASHAAVGDTLGEILTPLIILVIVAASWALRPPSRRLALYESLNRTN